MNKISNEYFIINLFFTFNIKNDLRGIQIYYDYLNNIKDNYKNYFKIVNDNIILTEEYKNFLLDLNSYCIDIVDMIYNKKNYKNIIKLKEVISFFNYYMLKYNTKNKVFENIFKNNKNIYFLLQYFDIENIEKEKIGFYLNSYFKFILSILSFENEKLKPEIINIINLKDENNKLNNNTVKYFKNNNFDINNTLFRLQKYWYKLKYIPKIIFNFNKYKNAISSVKQIKCDEELLYLNTSNDIINKIKLANSFDECRNFFINRNYFKIVNIINESKINTFYLNLYCLLNKDNKKINYNTPNNILRKVFFDKLNIKIIKRRIFGLELNFFENIDNWLLNQKLDFRLEFNLNLIIYLKILTFWLNTYLNYLNPNITYMDLKIRRYSNKGIPHIILNNQNLIDMFIKIKTKHTFNFEKQNLTIPIRVNQIGGDNYNLFNNLKGGSIKDFVKLISFKNKYEVNLIKNDIAYTVFNF